MLRYSQHSLSPNLYFVTRWLGEKYDGIRVCWNPKLYTVYLGKKEGRGNTNYFDTCLDSHDMGRKLLCHTHLRIAWVKRGHWTAKYGISLWGKYTRFYSFLIRFGRSSFHEAQHVIASDSFEINWQFLRYNN